MSVGINCKRRTCVVGIAIFAATLFISRAGYAQTPQRRSATEQAAVKVVNDWDAAWATKDVDKVAAFMAEDCVFRGDPREPALKKGRAAFVAELKDILALGVTMKTVATYAAGGETGTAVLQRRIDTITINGKKMTVPLVAFFRVKDGKIQEWLDMPLVELGPPPGAPNAPGGPGNRGN